MKKLLVFGTLCLALGLGSCKTYCPAYNYAKVEIQEAQNPLVPTTAPTAASVRSI